jgi:acetylornithine deacetylase/succinyl-diaminopimelate desuccinylase-like protein
MRTVPGQSTSEFFCDLEERLRARTPGIEVEMSHTYPLETDPAHPLIRRFEAGGAKLVGAPWFCDAAIFAHRGVPAIAMGPGSIAQAHTEDEWISEADLEEGAARFESFLRALQ